MKTRFLLITILLVINICAFAQDKWVRKADFGGTGRYNAVAFSIGSKGYLGTGYSSVVWHKDFWEYDVINNVWTQKADFAGNNREQAVAFSINGKGYISTGIFSDDDGADYVYKDLWEYDPQINQWNQKKDFGGVARHDAVAFAVGGKGYVGTGTFHGFYNDFWEYDPIIDEWKRIADFGGTGRSMAVGFNVGNKGYVGTGGGSGGYYNDFWEYDPSVDLWSRKADVGGPDRQEAVGFSIDGKGYIGMGQGRLTNGFLRDIWQYNPTSNTWLQKTDLPDSGRSSAISFTINDTGYISTGYSYDYNTQRINYHKDLWFYKADQQSDTCISPLQLSVLKVTNTAALLSWSLPVDTTNGYRIRYISTSGKDVHRRTVNGSTNHVLIHGLLPGTTYKWQMKSFCATDTSAWITGPAFTTTISSSITANINNDLQTTTGLIKVIPNPNNGVFVLQMQLPGKRIPTSITLYNAEGKRAWQQDLGSINGYINYQVHIDTKLAAGVYTLRVERNDLQLTQKLIINK